MEEPNLLECHALYYMNSLPNTSARYLFVYDNGVRVTKDINHIKMNLNLNRRKRYD